MKKSILGLVAVLAFGFAGAQTISFDKTTVEYGTVKFDSDGQRFVTVKNTGDKPLIINDVKAGCGCTTPKFSKEPILPGKTAQIQIGYNTKLRGPFTKNIEVFSNDPKNERSVLYINGIIEDPTSATLNTKPSNVQLVEQKVEKAPINQAAKKKLMQRSNSAPALEK